MKKCEKMQNLKQSVNFTDKSVKFTEIVCKCYRKV